MNSYPNERPETRGECYHMPRPCPFVSCKYHLAHDIMKADDCYAQRKGHYMSDDGKLMLRVVSDDPTEMKNTCVLDIADGGPVDMAHMELGISRERIRQVQNKALAKLDKTFLSEDFDYGSVEQWGIWDEITSRADLGDVSELRKKLIPHYKRSSEKVANAKKASRNPRHSSKAGSED